MFGNVLVAVVEVAVKFVAVTVSGLQESEKIARSPLAKGKLLAKHIPAFARRSLSHQPMHSHRGRFQPYFPVP